MNKQHAALLSIISNTLLIVFKLIAGLLMNSVSVISESIHSFIDLLASIIAFFSIKASEKPEDEKHPFGHGKYENISGFIEAILIFFAAIVIIYESAKKLISGVKIESLSAGILVMLVSSIVNLIISSFLLKMAKKTNSLALEADGMHLLTDVFTSFGVFLGLIAIYFTGIKILDPIIAILVSFLIIKAAIDLTKKSMDGLLDSNLPDEELQQIITIVTSHPEIKGYHKLRTRLSGSKREIDIHIQIKSDTTIGKAHEISNSIEKEIKSVFTGSHCVVHIEPEENYDSKIDN